MVKNKTPEQLALEEKDRRTNLKKFCNSILQKIGELDNRSGDRAIWELCQNARDLSDHAIIKITLDNEYFTFAHKGKPFNEDSLLSLVKQVSAEEKEETEAAGQFGTGFVTTHKFSRNFYLNASFQSQTGKIFDLDHFEIDRSEDSVDRFIDKMGAQINAVFDLLKNEPVYHLREWTEIIYPIDSDKREIALRAMASSEKMIPYVLTLNDRIEKVILENRIDGNTFVFKKNGSSSAEDGLNVQRIETSQNECKRDVNVYFLQQGDSKIILPLECVNKAIPSNDIAKLFVWFPLLGTEDWGTNFIYHADFYPLEKRNGIVLPCDNSEIQAKYQHNVDTLQNMNAMLFDYLKEHASQLENSLEISKIDFLSHNVDDSKTEDFFKSQQEVWTKEFRSLSLIDTPLGRKSLDDGVKIPNREICKFFANKDETYFEAFYEISFSAGLLLPNKDVCLKWADIIHQWALIDESEHEISLADVARNVTEAVDKKILHKLIEIVNGCNQSDLLKDIPLIPNREGTLRVVGSLRNGKNITDDLYKRAFLICAEDMKKMVHTDFTDIYSFTEYTRDDLRQSVSTVNENAKKEMVKNGKCFSDKYTEALRGFSSIFSTENPTSNRYQIMKSLSILKGFELAPCYIPKVDEKEGDYCYSSFIYLLESELLDISKKSVLDKNWYSDNKQKLLDFLVKVTLIKEKDKSARLLGSNGYAVVPNQLGNLCKLEALKIRDEQISDKLADLYKDVKEIDLRENWIDADFSKLLPDESVNKDNAKDVALEVETSLLEDYDESHQVSPQILAIIQNIESKDEDAKLWKSWFKRIDEKKADINWNMVPAESKPSFYRLMKVAADKDLLDDLADFSENSDIFRQFKNYLRARQQEDYEFEFKKQLGQKIECLVQERLKRNLGEIIGIECEVDDCQGGQDLVVRLGGDAIYYIECKAKWNFDEPAHMSKLQIRRAYNEQGHYALCAVDMSSFNGAIKDSIPSIDEIEKYIHVHLNVIDELSVDIESLLAIKEDSNEHKITISTDYKLNIPKSVFNSGVNFDDLVDSVVECVGKN